MILVVGGTGDLGGRVVRRLIDARNRRRRSARGGGSHRTLSLARLVMKVLGWRNDAMACIIGTGVMIDPSEVTWDDTPLRERGIASRSATDWITQEATARPPARGC